MKTEITKIKIQLKDREIEITAQEARQLHEELTKLFDLEKSAIDKLREDLEKMKPEKEFVPYPPYPPPYYPAPIIIDRTVPTWPTPWIWCGSGNAEGQVAGDTICMAIGAN